MAAAGGRAAAGGLIAAWRLMRPAQWPILTAQLAVGVLLAAPPHETAGAWWANLSPGDLLVVWLVWVVALNGGTLAFNSAYDRDTGPVAYLARPPLPPPWLAGAALALMAAGTLLGAAALGAFCGSLVGVCTLLSIGYSHPATRWKSRPGLDLTVNMLGYGAGTTLAGLAAAGGPPGASGWWFTAAFGFLFGSFYPLTQIYQTGADRLRGDRTLTTALGVPASLLLAIGLAAAAAAAMWLGLRSGCREGQVLAPGAVLLLWLAHLVWWKLRAAAWSDREHERGMYRALGLWALLDVALAWAWLRG